jgi:Flp pilus assembly protein TadD
MGSRATIGAMARGFALLLLCGGVTACASQENMLLAGPNAKQPAPKVEDAAFFPSDDYLRMGKVYFRNESYGLAAQSYQKAVEVTPKDAEAWLGLAASYDHLRRFDLADQAYEKVLQLASQNAAILNNAGYSQLLRGNLKSARKFLLRAYELEPDNPYIQNNLKLLGESEKSVKRPGN